MKHTIYTKLLISYLIYGVIAFLIICTFTQHLTIDHIKRQEASNLYREASIIAGDYASEYFGSSMSLSDFQNHMKIVADYMDALPASCSWTQMTRQLASIFKMTAQILS